ncbi:MAG: PAN domain-containing protein, partial [Pseudomonadota bacterium]|nr:PAN domain-containing protein [Pseudomonadota bacterium]
MDYGGSPHNCGYASIIIIYSDNSTFPTPSWYPAYVAAGESLPVTYNTLLDSPEACQDLCAATPGCDFFAYEWEETASSQYHECYLKRGYSFHECPHPISEQYVPWSNPSDPDWHGVSGPAVCTPPPPAPPPCIYESMDYGRSSSPCGVELGGAFAPMVAIYYDNTLYDVPGWFSGPAIHNPLMSTEHECQSLCAALPTCDFFSYEYELLDPVSAGLYGHECFLKTAYSGCSLTDPMAGYGTWTSSDPGWVGHSGPEMCPGAGNAAPDRSCLLVGMDYGGSPHDCGYASIIVIYSDNSTFPTPSWYPAYVAANQSLPVTYNTLLDSPGACQD